MISVLEWMGCFLGLAGALLLSVNNRFSAWGWVFFLMSNAAWIVFGLVMGAMGLVAMQTGFTLTSLIGVWKWLVVPRLTFKTVHKNRE